MKYLKIGIVALIAGLVTARIFKNAGNRELVGFLEAAVVLSIWYGFGMEIKEIK